MAILHNLFDSGTKKTDVDDARSNSQSGPRQKCLCRECFGTTTSWRVPLLEIRGFFQTTV